MWAKHCNNDPLPWSFQGYYQPKLTGFTPFLRKGVCNHPPGETPTMESWSRSSRRDKLVLWSQEYFRLMESWRFLKNDSRSRASLKNCGDTGRGSLCSPHRNTKILTEKEQPSCAELRKLITLSWMGDSSLQRPWKYKLVVLWCHGQEILVMTCTKPTEPHGKVSLHHVLRNHHSFLLTSD